MGISTTAPPAHRPGAPRFGPINARLIRKALSCGWSDLRRAPIFGIAISAVYVLAGWLLAGITLQTGTTFWLVLAVFGFPLLGPFVAVGFYEVSRRLHVGDPLNWLAILGVVVQQRNRSLPMIGAICVVIFLFWFFLGHMIFALFLGLSPMSNVSSSFEVFLTPNGLAMLAVGTTVGAAFALILYMITVLSLPMVLDREVDFVTAMAASFRFVAKHPMPMLGWAAFMGFATLVSLVPFFLGLLIALPLLGHTTWHIYRLVSLC